MSEKSNGTLLIIEDEPSLQVAFEATFTTEGYRVVTASDGADGLALLKRDHYGDTYDGIMLDLRMPGIDGMGVMKTLHELGIRMPILLTSAHVDTAVAVRATYYGVVDFLRKPSTPAEMREAMFGVLNDTKRFSQVDDFEPADATERLKWAKWNLRLGKYEKALECLTDGDTNGNGNGLGSWRVICEHLIAITDHGTKAPEFASDNFYDAANLLDKIALNRA